MQNKVSTDPDSRVYSKLTQRIKKLEAEAEGRPAKRQTRSVYLTWERTPVFESYMIKEHQGVKVIVAKGRHPRFIPLGQEPDLFVRFAELPATDDAYLSFVSRYGLPGLQGKRYGYSTPAREEPWYQLNDFHERFKGAFNATQAIVGREPLSDLRQHALHTWLSSALDSYTRLILRDLSGRIALGADTLAGVLILQLYAFLIDGKKLQACQRPGCQALTTRKKFCSDIHRSQFNAWKDRGKIVEINGEWQMAPDQPKRGRPAKNPRQRQAETTPGAGKI